MSEKSFTKVKSGVVKRTRKRVLGVFIDGSSLDRATRRMQKKIDLPRLVSGVSAGLTPLVARYYTLIPYEDDSRQRAFLEAVQRAGLQVVVKRLPPIGITRQVSVEVEMAADIMAFGLGQNSFPDIGLHIADSNENSDRARKESRSRGQSTAPMMPGQHSKKEDSVDAPQETPQQEQPSLSGTEERIVTVLCPGRDLSYPFRLLGSLDIQTVSADFGQASGRELIKSASKWIDLSDSETIWRGE